MLFSGAAISLAARGHWAPEHSWPALLSVCLPTSDWLSTSTCLSAWLHVCFLACQIICLSRSPASLQRCVHMFVSEGRCTRYPGDQGSRLEDTKSDNRGFWKITWPCSVPIRLLSLPSSSPSSCWKTSLVRLGTQLNTINYSYLMYKGIVSGIQSWTSGTQLYPSHSSSSPLSHISPFFSFMYDLYSCPHRGCSVQILSSPIMHFVA